MLQWIIALPKYASECDLNSFILWDVDVYIFFEKGGGGELMDRNERTQFRTQSETQGRRLMSETHPISFKQFETNPP